MEQLGFAFESATHPYHTDDFYSLSKSTALYSDVFSLRAVLELIPGIPDDNGDEQPIHWSFDTATVCKFAVRVRVTGASKECI